ncbi:M1 family metallopeptidase [Azospirillum sp.]|uniref:M1 family metallopeptidase n=1 Tax=Azospirillum sp. TaxID=34012 RepID=UPI002D2A2F03|nr:M1 family aminopeptidase [Azospirillum sp.]HYD68458.1 M1 family aminopeptidase [Azospirillum sp.]
MLRSVLALAAFLAAAPVLAAGIHHDLDVTLDPPARRLEVVDRVTLPAGAQSLLLAPGLDVAEVTAAGKALPFTRSGARLALTVPEGGGAVTVRYAGTLAALDPDAKRDGPMAGAEGAYLPGGGWIPAAEGEPPTWRLAVRVPAPFTAVATGRLVEEGRDAKGYRAVFAEDRPVEEPSLFAGTWEVRERMHGTLRLRTYFHPEQAGLSDEYLDITARAIDGFSQRIGAYPFAGFAVVSAPLPVGLGFPGLTYIGRQVLPLPFVRGQSLAHEILHNWWGNGVRVDYATGNWCEGLTSYLSDYASAEARGGEAARAARLDWVRDYAALPRDRDTALGAFRAKVHGAAQVIGYGKAAAVFHMLRGEVGEAAFDAGLRRFWEEHKFRQAGWADLRAAFEAAAGRDLKPFFAQWVERVGAPSLTLQDARVAESGVSVALRQDAPVYALSVPVVVETDAGPQRHLVRMEGREAAAVLPVTGRATAVAVDPGHDLFRRLAPGEAPAVLRDVTLDTGTNVVIAADGGGAEAARALADRLMEGRARVVGPDRTDAGEPLLLLGTQEGVERLLRAYRMEGAPEAVAGRGTARVWTARTARGQPALVVAATDPAALQALLRPLPHYGRQSWLVFDGARAMDRGVWPPGDSPLRRRLD